MTKILLPLLVLAGLVLGLVLLLRRRRVVVPGEGSWVKIAILTAAALVVGTSGPVDAKGKKTCYKPATNHDVFPDIVLEPMEAIQQRIELLEKLHAQGKLTDAVYAENLAGLEAAIAEAEVEKQNKKALTKAEKKLVDIRRALDGRLLKKLNKQPAWKVLNKQVRQLLKLVDGKKNTHDPDAVDEALGALHDKGLIDASTRASLSTVLDGVRYHYERSHGGKTCYKMSILGMHMSGSRGKLTTLLESIGGQKMTGKKFAENLGILATSVTCLQQGSKETCESGAGTYDRVSMVTTLDLLVSLAK